MQFHLSSVRNLKGKSQRSICEGYHENFAMVHFQSLFLYHMKANSLLCDMNWLVFVLQALSSCGDYLLDLTVCCETTDSHVQAPIVTVHLLYYWTEGL